ncbi:unnamed protein product [Arabidopsis halleri]
MKKVQTRATANGPGGSLGGSSGAAGKQLREEEQSGPTPKASCGHGSQRRKSLGP